MPRFTQAQLQMIIRTGNDCCLQAGPGESVLYGADQVGILSTLESLVRKGIMEPADSQRWKFTQEGLQTRSSLRGSPTPFTSTGAARCN